MVVTCGDCLYLDINDYRYNKYYCPKQKTRKDLMDKACPNIVKRKNLNEEYKPAGCYITTIVCTILGYEDNCLILNTFRLFRDNYLLQNPKYVPLLVEYDQIGPIISSKLLEEENPKEYATILLHAFILPCMFAIKNNDFKEATDIYINMVSYLKTRYDITQELDLSLQNPKETLGKGRKLIKENVD